MSYKSVLAAVALVALSVSFVAAEKPAAKSGLQAGESIGAFFVEKVAGASDDNVKVGANLCYRCKNGNRPQVMIFTRSNDEKVGQLVAQLDKAIEKHSDKQLTAFVNYLGDSPSAAKAEAKKLASSTKAKNVPFVVPNEFENGPADYGINSKVDVTIIVANKGQVKANHSFATSKAVDAKAVLADIEKLLK